MESGSLGNGRRSDVLRLARTDECLLHGDRTDHLIDGDDGDHNGGEFVSPFGEAAHYLHGQTQAHPGLSEEGHAGDPVETGGIAAEVTAGVGAQEDGAAAHGDQQEGDRPGLPQGTQIEPGSGQGEEEDVDRQANCLDRLDEFAPLAGVVLDGEAGGHADQQRLQVDAYGEGLLKVFAQPVREIGDQQGGAEEEDGGADLDPIDVVGEHPTR